MENLIQQLKDNEKCFCLLSSEMQDFILGCKAEDLEYLSSNSTYKNPEWRTNANSSAEIKRSPLDTFRLRADYEEEPEKIEVRIIRGDGWISPVSTSSISAHVKEFDGKKWVSVVALNEANKSIANAEYWLKHLNVWGNSGTVQKIYKIIGLAKDGTEKEPKTEEPEIVECKIYPCVVNGLLYDKDGKGMLSISNAINDPDFAGFLYKPVFGEEIYMEPWLNLDMEHNGNHKVTHASHVRFRRKKP